MNEGWATFWHYVLIQKLYDEKLVNDSFMLEFLQLHTNVTLQLPFNHPAYSGINPYTLGFKLFWDIKESSGDNWVEAVDFAMRNYKDESFIGQYLSPKVIRDLKLFSILDDENDPDLVISAIHNEDGYQRVRDALSSQYNLSQNEPDIQVYNVNQRGDRSLTLRYIPSYNRPLGEDTETILKYLHYLWGFTVRLETVDAKGEVVSTREWPVG
jgi:stage V sporulation protein R